MTHPIVRERVGSDWKATMKKKRDLFAELNEGFDALAEWRAGKRALRMHAVKVKPAAAREASKLPGKPNPGRGGSH